MDTLTPEHREEGWNAYQDGAQDEQLPRRRRFPEKAGHLAVEILKHPANIAGVEILDAQTVMFGRDVDRSDFRTLGAQ